MDDKSTQEAKKLNAQSKQGNFTNNFTSPSSAGVQDAIQQNAQSGMGNATTGMTTSNTTAGMSNATTGMATGLNASFNGTGATNSFANSNSSDLDEAKKLNAKAKQNKTQ